MARPKDQCKRRLRSAGTRVMSAVENWTAPGGRPELSDAGLSTLVATVSVGASLLFLIAMVVTWLSRS